MKDSNHTPGPWIATGSAIEDVDITEIRTVDERLLAEVLPYDTLDGMAEMDANARLIAAAPELLEAAQAVREELDRYGFINNSQDNDPDGHESPAIGKLLAAIDKATGQR